MRPTRLEIAGFASFREPTTISFEDLDLFAFTGPTGSGKSSLIDAMVFALYGAVPRYDDRRLVEPVISRGKLEARVRLDFRIGERELTAVRVVQRNSAGGATTKEARLEEDGRKTLAGSAPELSAAVERELGLTFEHFTRSVVLPQGDFADFLHAKPSERQDLLVELLGLDIYRRIARRANETHRDAGARAGVLRGLLDGEYSQATPERVRLANQRVDDLTKLLADLRSREAAAVELQARADAVQAQAERQASQARALEGVALPPQIAEFAARLGAAKSAEAADQATWKAAQIESDAAAEVREKMGDGAQERRWQALRGELAECVARQATATESASAAQIAAQAAKADLASATDKFSAAQDALEAARHTHLAHALVGTLVAGEACPVCRQIVVALPAGVVPTDLTSAERQLEEARATVAAAQAALGAADAIVSRAAQTLDGLEERRQELTRGLEGAPDDEALAAGLEELAASVEHHKLAQEAARAAMDAYGSSQAALAALAAEAEQSLAALDRHRDDLAALELRPPDVDRSDLGAAWRALAEWAAREAPVRRGESERLKKEALAAVGAAREARAAMDELATVAGVDPAGQTAVEACAHALGEASAAAEHAKKQFADAEKMRGDLHRLTERAQVAQMLGLHLKRDRFEKWLLGRALSELAGVASAILRELSPQNAHSLRVAADGEFRVVDHWNGDEERPARSLSGGETFLASLSLALALADQLAQYGHADTSRLEALFIDEGFGSLDADSLDVVAAAIAELGAKGRMVGVVTHVPELAARFPVQFVVAKTAAGSTVERVEV
jgi:DNA repair protein SbcC/Rad50